MIHIAFRDEHNFKLDGDLNNWQGIKPLIIKDGEKTLAKVYLAWNTYYIYAAFDVTTPTPWKNRSTAELAFQGGAAVDLNAAPLKLDAAKPLRGVYRVVTAPINGKTEAVEFCPLLPVEAPDCYRTDSRYKTLVGQVKFDRAARLEYGSPDNAGVKLKPDGSGYVVEMRLRRYIPLEFAPGFRFRLDASVILADPTGTRSVLRLPWHSRSNADMMVNDTYTEVQLRPRNWAEAVLE